MNTIRYHVFSNATVHTCEKCRQEFHKIEELSYYISTFFNDDVPEYINDINAYINFNQENLILHVNKEQYKELESQYKDFYDAKCPNCYSKNKKEYLLEVLKLNHTSEQILQIFENICLECCYRYEAMS